MFVSEEKLAVEVAEVDCVEVDDVDFAEAGEGEVLEKFAADPAGADEVGRQVSARGLAWRREHGATGEWDSTKKRGEEKSANMGRSLFNYGRS